MEEEGMEGGGRDGSVREHFESHDKEWKYI